MLALLAPALQKRGVRRQEQALADERAARARRERAEVEERAVEAGKLVPGTGRHDDGSGTSRRR